MKKRSQEHADRARPKTVKKELVVTQALLEEFRKVCDLCQYRDKLRKKIMDLLDFGATVEHGKFDAYIDEIEQVRPTWDRLKAVLGEHGIAYLRAKIRPVIVRPLIVEER